MPEPSPHAFADSATPSPSAPPPMPANLAYAAPGVDHVVLPNEERAKRAKGLSFVLIGLLALQTLWLAFDLSLVPKVREMRRVNDQAGIDEIARMETVVNAGFAVLFFVAIVLFYIYFMMWLYRAVCNVRATSGNSYSSPGMSVGWWFIPLCNLLVPYYILKDLWHRSGARTATGNASLPTTLWVLWILPFIGGFVAGFYISFNATMNYSDPLDEFVKLAWMEIAGNAVSIVTYLLLIRFINRVTETASFETAEATVAGPAT